MTVCSIRNFHRVSGATSLAGKLGYPRSSPLPQLPQKIKDGPGFTLKICFALPRITDSKAETYAAAPMCILPQPCPDQPGLLCGSQNTMSHGKLRNV